MISTIKNYFSYAGFQKYFFNTSWLFAEQGFRFLLGILVSVWVARYLGPDKYGCLNYAIAFVALFVSIAGFGLDSIVIRELVKKDIDKNILLGTSFFLKLMGAALVMLALSIAINFTNNSKYTKILILIIGSAAFLKPFGVIDFYFQSQVLSKYTALSNSISSFFSAICKIIIIFLEGPLIAFVILYVLENLVIAAGLVCFYKKEKQNIRLWKFDFSVSKSLLKTCLPIMFSGIMVMIHMRIDQVMIKSFLSLESVGTYSAALRLSEVWYFIPMTLTASLFPAIINARKADKGLYYKRLQRLFDFMVWMTIAIALPTTLLADWVINLLYGSQYALAGGVLKIHIWSGIFIALGIASGKWYVAENFIVLSFWRTVVGVTANILLNCFLIPQYGIEGAALATLLSQITANYLFDLFNSKTRIIFCMKSKTFYPVRIIQDYLVH